MAVTPVQLNQFMNQHFSLSELRALCFELGIPYDDLEGGDARAAKVLALVQYAQRHGVYETLVTQAQAQRPNAKMGDTAQTMQPAPQSTTTQTPTSSVTNIFYGPVTGGAGGVIGSGTVNAQNIAGGNITIGAEPKTRDEFAEQLKLLQALLQEAIAAKELPSERAAQTLTEDLQDVTEEITAEQPGKGRIIRRLEDVAEMVDSAGKVAETAGKAGALVLKAAPILAGLVKAAQVLF